MPFERLELQISDNSEVAEKGIDRLAAALGRLKDATTNSAGLNKVAKALQAVTTAANGTAFSKLDKAMAPITANAEKISAGLGAAQWQLKNFTTASNTSAASATKASGSYSKMGASLASLNAKANLTALYFGIKRVTSILGGFVQHSNQYVEDMNLFTVSMGKYADSAYEYAQRAQELMGIDAGQFMRNQGYFMSIASGFGVAGDSAALMSQNLAELGYDLASFYNSDVDTAMQKLQSGIAGELEPLRRWGFALDQVTLQEVALNNGINMNIRDMTQAQKSMVRYIAIMEQSVNAQHDMARTLTTPANAMRIFSQQVTLLSRSLGNLLIPILSAVLPYVIAFVKVLRMAAEAIAAFFHLELPTIDYDAFEGMSVGASAAEDMEDSLGGAAKAAKKMKDYVLGIDELNIFRPQEENAGGGSGAGGVGGGGFDGLDLPQYDFLEGLNKQADKLIPKIKNVLKWLTAIAAVLAVGKIIKSVANVGKFIKGLTGLSSTLGVLSKIVYSALGAIVAFGGGFILGEELTKLFTGQIEEVNGWVIALGATLSVVGTAILGVALGPAGILVGVLATLAGVVAGNHAAMQELNKAAMESLFFAPNGGVPIQTLIDRFYESSAAITDMTAKIAEQSSVLDNSKAAVSDLSVEWLGLGAELRLGLDDIDTFIADLQTSLDTMVTAVLDGVNTSEMGLLAILAGAGEYIERSGYDTGIAAEGVVAAADSVTGHVQGLADQYVALSNELANTTNYERQIEIWSELSGIMGELGQISGVDLSAFEDVNSALQDFSNIDFSSYTNFEDLKTEMDRLQTAFVEAQTGLEESIPEINRMLETLNLDGSYVAEAIAAGIEGMSLDLTDQFTVIGKSISAQADAIFAESVANYEFSWWDEINASMAASTGIVTIDEEKLNIAASSVQAQIDSVFGDTLNMTAVTEGMGADFAQGLANGILNNTDVAMTAISAFGESALSELQESLDEHSPSAATEKMGLWFDEGFLNGIDGGATEVLEGVGKLGSDTLSRLMDSITVSASGPIDAFRNMLNQMLGLTESFANNVVSGINSAMSGMVSAFNSVSYSGRTASFSYAGGVSVPRLASGGIVNSGQLFIANEAGPELVGKFGSQTGVVNNEQILDAMRQAVYEATYNAIADNSDIFGANVNVSIGDKDVYEANERGKRSAGYRIAPVGV